MFDDRAIPTGVLIRSQNNRKNIVGLARCVSKITFPVRVRGEGRSQSR